LTFWVVAYGRFDCISIFLFTFSKAFAGGWPLESLLSTARVELCEREAQKEDEVENSNSDHLEVSQYTETLLWQITLANHFK